jgi:hypothetical protein
MPSLTTRHGPFALPITQSLKPLQACNIWMQHALQHPVHSRLEKIGDCRQCQTYLYMVCNNGMQVDYDYKVGNKVLVKQDGILRKAESPYSKKP